MAHWRYPVLSITVSKFNDKRIKCKFKHRVEITQLSEQDKYW